MKTLVYLAEVLLQHQVACTLLGEQRIVGGGENPRFLTAEGIGFAHQVLYLLAEGLRDCLTTSYEEE